MKPRPSLLTVGEVRDKLALKSNQGVHHLVETGVLKVNQTLSDGMRLFDPKEVERVKRARIRDLEKAINDLRST